MNPVRMPKPMMKIIGNALKLSWTSSESANIMVPYAPKTNNINDPDILGNNIALEAHIPAK